MSCLNCNSRCNCTIIALIASVIVGVIAAFLQITGAITLPEVFLWVLFGISIAFLGILVVATALERNRTECTGLCPVLNLMLLGILGTIFFAIVLIAVGIVATSILSAILVGLLLLFFTLTLVSAACVIRCQADCGS